MSPKQLDEDTGHLDGALARVRQLSATLWRQDPQGRTSEPLIMRLTWHSAAMWQEARSAFPELEALEDESLWSAIVEGVVDAGEDAAAVRAAWDGPEPGSDHDAKPEPAVNSERLGQDPARLKKATESVRARSATLWRQNRDRRANRPLVMGLAWHGAAMHKEVRSSLPELAMLDSEQLFTLAMMGVVDAGEDVAEIEAALDRKLS